jgi:hypothetical protein
VKKEMIFVLMFNEWDGGDWNSSESVVASRNKESLKLLKKKMEDNSRELRSKLWKLEEENTISLNPLWALWHEYNHKINLPGMKTDAKMEERLRLLDQKNAIYSKVKKLNEKQWKKKEELKEALKLEYYIDDEDMAEFSIEELEIIK